MTEVGFIPNDWIVEPLANIANTASGGTPSRSKETFYKGPIKWFTTTELRDCNLYDSVEHISKQAVECSSAKIFPKDTLLMAMYGATIGKLGLLKCDAATNQACCAIFPKKTDVLYLYYFLLYNRENIIAMGCGAGQPNVSQEIVKKINIPLPPTVKEQTAIANILSDMDAEISALETKLAKYRTLKTGMMQQLLTGKIRLV
jgi:type I restriction enzyme S subunit